jgi:hypothetical protein
MAIVIAAGGVECLAAQEREPVDSVYINVDAGAQPQRRTVTSSSSFPLYDETATVTADQRIRNGGVFEVSAGMRVARHIALGVGISTFGRSGTAAITASIPHPAFFDRPAIITRDAADLAHSERSVHFRATWFRPISDAIDVAVSAGPSFIHVGQDLASTITVQPGTQTVTVVKDSQSANTVGVNFGVDASYMVSPGVGIGLFGRYTAGKVDLPNAPDLTVGGFQMGAGLRIRL